MRKFGAHGGEIAAFSEGPGKGSEFRVSLPIVTDTQVRIPPTAPSTPSAVSKGRRILVADDNVDGAESLAVPLVCIPIARIDCCSAPWCSRVNLLRVTVAFTRAAQISCEGKVWIASLT